VSCVDGSLYLGSRTDWSAAGEHVKHTVHSIQIDLYTDCDDTHEGHMSHMLRLIAIFGDGVCHDLHHTARPVSERASLGGFPRNGGVGQA
jgi:hypothetical protein